MLYDVIQLQAGIKDASLTMYIPELISEASGGKERPAVIICPGGAFMGITEKEAEPVALRFLSEGFCAFVLRYSIGAGMAQFPAPFIDAAAAVMLVRESAGRFGIDPDQICICGFSAGGHVAAFLAATWQEDYLSKALKKDAAWFKPNALLLGYPILDLSVLKQKNEVKAPELKTLLEMMFSNILGAEQPKEAALKEWNVASRITSRMPPTFLWSTTGDSLIAAEDYRDFISALSTLRIPYEYHMFEKGSHGMSLGDRTVGFSKEEAEGHGNTLKWTELAIDWVRQHLNIK